MVNINSVSANQARKKKKGSQKKEEKGNVKKEENENRLQM